MTAPRSIWAILSGASGEMSVVLTGRVGIAFFSLALLQLQLSVFDADEYGFFTFLIATASMMNALLFGAANLPITHFAAATDDDRAARVFQTGAIAVFLISFIGLAAVSTVFYHLSLEVMIGQSGLAGLSTGLWAAVGGIATVTSAFALGRRRRVYNLALNNGIVLSRIAAVSVLLAFGVSEVFSIMISMAVANFMVVVIALFALNKSFTLVPKARLSAAVHDSNFMHVYLNNWPVSVGNSLLLYGDKVYLAFFLPFEAIGLLAIYQQICRVVSNMTIGTFYQFISPFLLRGVEGAVLRQTIISSLAVGLFAFGPTMLLIWLLLPWITDFFLGEVFNLNLLELGLVGLAVSMSQSSKTNELLLFHMKRVDLLKYPLFASVLLFTVAAPFGAWFWGLTGVIWLILFAAITRYLLVLGVFWKLRMIAQRNLS